MKAHLRKQLLEHIMREEGHGVLKSLKRRTNVKLFAIFETVVQSKIRNSHSGNKHKRKDNSSSEMNGNAIEQAHACALFGQEKLPE